MPGTRAAERLEAGSDVRLVARELADLRRVVLELFERQVRGRDAAGVLADIRRFDTAIDALVEASLDAWSGARERTLQALDAASSAALGVTRADQPLPRLLKVFVDSAPAVDFASVLLREGDVLVELATSDGTRPRSNRAFRVRLGEGFLGRVALEREARVLHDASGQPLAHRRIGDGGIRALYAVPLVVDGDVIGVATMGSRTASDFAADGKQVFGVVAQVATALLVRSRLVAREQAARDTLLQVQAQGRASEEKYRTLFESIDQGFCILQLHFDGAGRPFDCRHVETNRHFERQTGLRDVLGRTLRELVPDIDPSWLALYGEVAATGEPKRLEKFAAPLGRWFDVYAFRVGGSEAGQVAVLLEDITARKRREANLALLGELTRDFSRLVSVDDLLQSASSRLGSYLDLTGLTLFDVDEAGDRITPRHSWHRGDAPSLTRIFDACECFADEARRAGRAGALVVVRDARADARTAEACAGIPLGGLVVVPYHEEGTWKGALAVYADVARDWRHDELELLQEVASRVFPQVERARAEEALRESEERLKRAVSIETVGVLHFNLSGQMLDANAALQRMSGYSRDELRKMNWRVLTPPEFMPPTERAAKELATVGRTAPYEKQWIRPDGSRWWGLFAPTRVAGSGTNAECMEFTIDISDLKRAQELSRERAEFAQQLMGIVSHDLRSPITAILLSAAAVLRRSDLDDRLRSALGRIVSAGERANRLIRDLLDFTQAQLGGGIAVDRQYGHDLCDLVEQIVDEVRPGYPDREIRLERKGCGAGYWDSDRLAQVVTNLVGNALQHSPPGTPVLVEISVDGREAVLSVTNEGEPIPAEATARLFEPYRRGSGSTKAPAKGGIGLGLFITSEIVRAHGGSIEVRSSSEQATTFQVRLPCEPGCGPADGAEGRAG